MIQLGSGSLQTGFPLVTAQLWERTPDLPQQFTGQLPAAPALEPLGQSWQALYRALCAYPPIDQQNFRNSSRPRTVEKTESDFEMDEGGIQQVSSYEFEELCQRFRTQFNQWLCSVEFSSIDRPLRSRLSLQDHIRIILTTQNDTIRRLPWQRWDLLTDFPNAEIALSLTQYRRPQRTPSSPRPHPRILAILGNTHGIDVTQEQALLEQLPQTDVTFLCQPSRQALHQALWDTTGWDLLFFAGHSSSDSSQRGRLYINSHNSLKHNSLTLDELSEALTAALEKGLQLAIFNSCDGLGLANQLAALNIPQTIVMREPVPNRVAQLFFQYFLNAYIQDSLPLYSAIKRSRRQLQSIEGDFPGASWLPILCQNPAEVPLDWADICQPQPPDPLLNLAPNFTLTRQDYRDRQIFLNKVRNTWIKGVLHKSLPAQATLTMGLVEQPDLLQTPAPLDSSHTINPLPPGTQLIDYFDELGMGRSLLLLGAPGAGKTIALLELAQTLVTRAEQADHFPLPVILNLSDWGSPNPRKRPSIYEWLQHSLSRYYQVPQAKTETWLQAGQLTLLFDGLDEIPTGLQAACIDAINQFRQDYAQVELIICCRHAVYQAIRIKLAVQSALVLQPLASDDIFNYCKTLGEVGQKAQELLERDRLLQTLASSPLMLNIIVSAVDAMDVSFTATTKASQHRTPPHDQPKTLDHRRHRLLNAYIDRMLSRRAQATSTPAETISGLRFLAQQLQHRGQSVFQIEAIQPEWLSTQSRQFQYPILLGIALTTLLSIIPTLVGLWFGGGWVALSIFVSWSLLGGGISGFIGGWLGGLTGGLIGGSVSSILLWFLIPRFSMGLIFTPIFALFMSFLFGVCREQIEPVERFSWSWRRASRWFLIGIGVGTLLSLPLLLANTVEGRVMTPIVAFLFMLFQGFSKRSHLSQTKARPNEGIWRTAQNAIHVGLLSTLIYGVLSWMILGLNTSSDWSNVGPSFQASLPFGAIAGGIMGTGMGLIGAEGSGVVCIQHLVVRLMLWQQNRIPWNYAQFLDGCVNQILLQKVGGNYIFLHRILLEHFADWRPSP